MLFRSGAANPFEWTPQYSTDEEWETYNVLEKKALDYFIHNAGSPDGVIDGGIAVFAGGNESAPAASYPGAYPDYVAVSATAGDFTPAVYTNYGPGTTIAAPGGDQDYYWDYVDESHKIGEIGCILSTCHIISVKPAMDIWRELPWRALMYQESQHSDCRMQPGSDVISRQMNLSGCFMRQHTR